MRAREFITEDKIQKGINIRVDGDVDYAGLIADGKKKYETRNSNSLKPYIGKTVAIVRTGIGPATAIGQVTIGEPIVADETTFEKLRKQHLVPAGSKFDITQGGIKYLYPMINPKRWEEEKPVTHHGIVARQVQWESKTITENLITHGDNQFKIERLEPGDEEYADMKVSVLDDWGNEAGFAKFASDGKDLDPRALKVHDRYRGQGFAKLIYDFMKSKGYRIIRSWDQTDDGAHFWDKNRGEEVRVWEDAENFNGIDISLEIQKDDEYVDDEDTENQVVFVKATSNGKELGYVIFSIEQDSQGPYLHPQDLEVEERYRGQGIAQTMYDFVKSKGYRIRRSGQQTDAGAGFWAKHRPEQNIWEDKQDVIVYHGNQGGIHKELITPMWWTEDKDTAVYYATQYGGDGYVYTATLSCKNPYVITDKDETNTLVEKYKTLMQKGYDSIYDPRGNDWIPFHAKDIQITDKEYLEGEPLDETVPQPGQSSGAPTQFAPGTKIQNRQMTASQIISSIPGVPYYNNVVDDYDAKDFSWGVTQKVIEYAKYLKQHPESLANLPPIQVLNGKFKDGAHRVSAIWLLQQRMDPQNSLWKNAKLNVQFAKQGVAEGKITLSTDPNWYGAEVGNYKASGPVVNIPSNRLVGFEPDDKMNQPNSKANVEKIVAGLKQGAKLPPLLVRKYKNGYQVLDGHHRFWAYKMLGVKSIPAQIVPDSDIEEKGQQGVAEDLTTGRNLSPATEKYIKNHKWKLTTVDPMSLDIDSFDDPFNRVIDIDTEHPVNLKDPVIVHHNGSTIIDGFHRVYQAQRQGLKSIPAYIPTKEELDESSTPSILYHATYRPLLKSIKQHGLGGDKAQAKWEDSKPGVVYLATDPNVAESYAESSDVVPDEWLDQIVVLKVNASQLDQSKLKLDRNVIDNQGDTLEYHGVIPVNLLS